MNNYDKLTDAELLLHRRYIDASEAGGDYNPATVLRIARQLLDHIDATKETR